MKRSIIFLLLIAVSFSISPICVIGQTSGPARNEKHPPQYGKPFNHVPDRRDVTIYQVNMRVFSKEGDFKGVAKRLDSIKALGANLIYLMPIYPVGVLKSTNSPYCVKDYLGINTEFGTIKDLRALVDGAHKRNMAVMLDWVGNHTSFDNPWMKNTDWYKRDSTGKIISPNGWNDIAQLNFANADMRATMINDMKYWVYTANIDGFRCDYSDGPPVDFWKQAIDSLKSISTHKLLMLAEGQRPANYAAGFDYNFGFNFFEDLEAVYKKNKSVQSIDSLNVVNYVGTSDGQQTVRYVTNHDVNSSDGTPLELFGDKKGSMAAFVVVAYMKGVPMIYNGQEVGTPYRLKFPFTSEKINWATNPDVTAEYKKIIAFRNASNAIRRGNLTSYTNQDICAFTKETGLEKVLVISNLRNKAVTFTVPAAVASASWKNAYTGSKTTLSSTVNLEPYSYIVLKN
ncbi:alpha-amylase family glycosyl hydrolase [uncultured Mucilaginibacter sp.]|uniref:alpha-amylase family glycosyl hydrolase n=1 Tax=uncultured Mucilaginibacter sp. TaxID=797541 RepID=UPI00261AD51A|nr:alpha-amylase family glycosyl hydrolase [uncultured Mucilaginibacter sp.]